MSRGVCEIMYLQRGDRIYNFTRNENCTAYYNG